MIMKDDVGVDNLRLDITIEVYNENKDITAPAERAYGFNVSSQLLPDLLKWCKWAEKYGGVDDRPKIKEKDNCERCKGDRGGVKGNENVIDGVVLCDYCHADMGIDEDDDWGACYEE